VIDHLEEQSQQQLKLELQFRYHFSSNKMRKFWLTQELVHISDEQTKKCLPVVKLASGR
jgi:hypothetical protein